MAALRSVEWGATEGFQGRDLSLAAGGIKIGGAQCGRGDRTLVPELHHILTPPSYLLIETRTFRSLR